jgi:chromosome partitioning protein
MAISKHRKLPQIANAHVIAVANQKGGVAKTTTVVHIGSALAELGYAVLLVDLDPQGHLGEMLGIVSETLPHEISDVLAGERRINDIILPNVRPDLDLAPSNIRLSDMELTLVNARFREYKVKRILEPVLKHYDYILLDCPPNLGLLTLNALIAANFVLIPMASEYLSMLGVSLLLKTIVGVQAEGNPGLTILGILHTRYKRRTIHAREVVNRTREELGDSVKVFDTPIGDSTRFTEASGLGKTVYELAPDFEGAAAYRSIAEEIVNATQ